MHVERSGSMALERKPFRNLVLSNRPSLSSCALSQNALGWRCGTEGWGVLGDWLGALKVARAGLGGRTGRGMGLGAGVIGGLGLGVGDPAGDIYICIKLFKSCNFFRLFIPDDLTI